MACWKIELRGKGIQKRQVEAVLAGLKEKFGEGVFMAVTDSTPPESRAGRYSVAQGLIEEAKEEFETLRDELQEWSDNLPENFQDKKDEIDEAISGLDEAIGNAELAAEQEIAFPSMY